MDYINVDLLFRDRQPQDPLSANFWACELSKSFEEFNHLVQLGNIALLTHFMRVCHVFPNFSSFNCSVALFYLLSWTIQS